MKGHKTVVEEAVVEEASYHCTRLSTATYASKDMARKCLSVHAFLASLSLSFPSLLFGDLCSGVICVFLRASYALESKNPIDGRDPTHTYRCSTVNDETLSTARG